MCRGTCPSETSPDPGTVSEPPTPLCSVLGSPVCAVVISLMMCNALKALHQPYSLKRSMGNALGRFSSHPQPLSLSHFPACPCLGSLSCRRLCCPSVLPEPHFFPSAFLSCLPQLYPDSLSLLSICVPVFPLLPPPWRLNWAFEPATPTQMDKRDLALTSEPTSSLAAKGTLGWT